MKETLEKIASYVDNYSAPVLSWGLVLSVPPISCYLAYDSFKNKKYNEAIAAASLAASTAAGIIGAGVACIRQSYNRRSNSYNSLNKS